MEEDLIQQRQRKYQEYRDKWKAYLKPEQLLHKGKPGSSLMTYDPNSFIHQRDLSHALVEQYEKKLSLH